MSDDMPYQLDLFMSEQKREKLEKMDQVVDEIHEPGLDTKAFKELSFTRIGSWHN